MDDHKQWLDRIKQDLEQSSEQLDADTRARLTAARRKALAALPERSASWPLSWLANWWQPAGAVAMVAAAVFAVMLWQARLGPDAELIQSTDLDLIASSDNLNLYEELEFYQWLDEVENGAG